MNQETKSPYTKKVTYTFKAGGYTWAVLWAGKTHVYVEDTRKNGQEDCHMAEEISLVDGKWVYGHGESEYWENSIETYHSEGMAEAVLAFITEHGPPVFED